MADSITTRFEKKILSYLPLISFISAHFIMMGHHTSRMYLPYMISSYAFAAAVYIFYYKIRSGKTLYNFLFSKEVWLHESSVSDYFLFLFNYLIYFHFLIYFVEDWHYLQVFIHDSIVFFNGLHTNENSSPGILACIIFTTSILLLGELTYYLTHRAYHEIPFLWELHKVHHSAEVMTPITFIRAHPIDLMIQATMRLLSIAIASGVFLYFYPNKDGLIMVAGVDAGLFLYYVIGANLHHSHVWISFGRPLEHILISPAQHQIHHSKNPKHFDKNYGSMLAIWDWLFGSLYIPEKDEKIHFGLGPEEYKNYDSAFKLVVYPMQQMALIAAGIKKTPKRKKKKKKKSI